MRAHWGRVLSKVMIPIPPYGPPLPFILAGEGWESSTPEGAGSSGRGLGWVLPL